jgi:outer membrane protein OmpA-like peptidoglycan-associated protein
MALLSAERATGQLKVRLKISNPGSSTVDSAADYLFYKNVYAFDPLGKRKYPLLKDSEGLYLAQPKLNNDSGGLWALSYVEPGGQKFMNLTFQAPPDSIRAVDIVVPWFAPLEAVAISGEGGATESGVAVGGKSLDLERAMKDLAAEETPKEIRVNLSADVLFDFDKAQLKPEAEPSLEKVATVLKANPGAQVTIEGHTDGKGTDSYNQPLSEKRAASVAQWFVAHNSLSAANVHTKGWGKSKPIAPNTKPDGSDDPDGRAKNRRVEIVVKKS